MSVLDKTLYLIYTVHSFQSVTCHPICPWNCVELNPLFDLHSIFFRFVTCQPWCPRKSVGQNPLFNSYSIFFSVRYLSAQVFFGYLLDGTLYLIYTVYSSHSVTCQHRCPWKCVEKNPLFNLYSIFFSVRYLSVQVSFEMC